MKRIIKELQEYEVEVVGFDPLLNAADLENEFGIKLFKKLDEVEKVKVDCIILAVAHSPFRRLSLVNLKEMQNNAPILIDVRGIFDARMAKEIGLYYKTL